MIVEGSHVVQSQPSWLLQLLGLFDIAANEAIVLGGKKYILRDNILRADSIFSGNQSQTKETFGFKWQKRNTYESEASLHRMKGWLIERYGNLCEADWWTDYGDSPLLLDAGCGAAMSAIELFEPIIPKIHYLGVDISTAIDVAAERFAERGLPGAFIQTDVLNIPLPQSSVDVIFSEGVLHHTESTEVSLKKLSGLLRPGGRFLFYVYRKKGPIREFTDDYIRSKIQEMSPEEGWKAMLALTQLGDLIGQLNIDITIPEAIDLLEIPKGKINLQRLLYWHVLKNFYHPELTIEEMNHINFDWYAPANAHRQTPEEIRQWCEDVNLHIEREVVEQAGVTVMARKICG